MTRAGSQSEIAGMIGHQHQHDEHHAVERPDLAHHLLHRDLADRAADEQHRADRRRGSRPMPRLSIMIMPKCTGSTPKLHHHRQQDRRADQDQRRHVHQAAEHQQHDVDQHQDDVLVARTR